MERIRQHAVGCMLSRCTLKEVDKRWGQTTLQETFTRPVRSQEEHPISYKYWSRLHKLKGGDVGRCVTRYVFTVDTLVVTVLPCLCGNNRLAITKSKMRLKHMPVLLAETTYVIV
jgi:hypothetical protein